MKKPYNYYSLRVKFNSETEKDKLSNSTISRYESWIRRFLKFCKRNNLEISSQSAEVFLNTYTNCNTRRQGYFALQFLFKKTIKKSFSLPISDYCTDKNKKTFLTKLKSVRKLFDLKI